MLYAAKKFVYNQHIDYEAYYLPYLKELLLIIPMINCSSGIFLVIDGSQTGKHHAALMLSLVIGKRSLPIRWLVKQGGKEHFSTQNHLELMAQSYPIFETILPFSTTVTLLGDGDLFLTRYAFGLVTLYIEIFLSFDKNIKLLAYFCHIT